MTPQQSGFETPQTAPATRKARSPVLGCLGLLLFIGTVWLTCGGVASIAQGERRASVLAVLAFLVFVNVLGLVGAYYGFSKRTVAITPDFSEAKRARAAFLAGVDTSHPETQQTNAAAALMLDKRYEDAIAAYRAIAQAYPDERGTAYSQIGAACYFLGRFAEAIQNYEQALAHGADPGMMRDNIAEARAALR